MNGAARAEDAAAHAAPSASPGTMVGRAPIMPNAQGDVISGRPLNFCARRSRMPIFFFRADVDKVAEWRGLSATDVVRHMPLLPVYFTFLPCHA